jgi:hypothetical protein
MNQLCPICNSCILPLFTVKILLKIDAHLMKCSNCGWCGYNNPSWINEAYQQPISLADTGILQRNILLSRACTNLFLTLSLHHSNFLDAAGGYGLLVRLMRDNGFNFYWSDQYAENIFAKGFEAESSSGLFEVVTMFEVLEHLVNPLGFLLSVIEAYHPSLIVFSTELYSGKNPDQDWWYLVNEAGQHISFYNTKTLEYMGSALNLSYTNYNGLHIYGPDHILATLPRTKFKRLLAYLVREVNRRGLRSRTLEDHLTMKQHAN